MRRPHYYSGSFGGAVDPRPPPVLLLTQNLRRSDPLPLYSPGTFTPLVLNDG